MHYECVGCGKVEQFDPPREVMPRMVLDHWKDVLCSFCKGQLEGFLSGKYVEWVRERGELVRLNKSRRPNPHQSGKVS